MATPIAWRISVLSLLILAWLSHSGRQSEGHVAQAEKAFASGDYRLAARILRQVEPRELPSQASTLSYGAPAYPPGQRNPAPSVGYSPNGLAVSPPTLMTPASCVRPALAAAEYSAGRPDRAGRVMGIEALRAAGLAWPGGASSMPPVQVFRYLRSFGDGTRGGMQVRTLHALIAREAAEAAPDSLEDRLAYARAVQTVYNNTLLPSAETVYAEALKIDPRNKEALMACGRVEEASRLYPDDPNILHVRLQNEKSPAQRERTLLAIIRLEPAASLSECQELVKMAIAARDYPKALRHLELVRRSHLSSAAAYYWKKRGWILAETGRIPEALAAYAGGRQVRNSWEEHAILNYAGVAYLQAHDVRHARDAFSAADEPGWASAQSLFAAWCADQITPPAKGEPGELEHCLAKAKYFDWQTPFPNSYEDHFTLQSERILKAYPDCFPAAVLLVNSLYDRGAGAADPDVEKRVRAAVAPFAARFPKQVAEMLQPYSYRRQSTARQTVRGTGTPAPR